MKFESNKKGNNMITTPIFKITSRSTDREHTGTILELVEFVNNHPDCRAKDYTISYGFLNNESNFAQWLKIRGFDFDYCGRAIKPIKQG